MQPHKVLERKKILHLSDHCKGNRASAGFKTILAFLSEANYVPGFPDVLIITPASKVKSFRDVYKALPLKKKTMFNLVFLPSNLLGRINRPDVIWIDDVNIIQSDVAKIVLKAQRLPSCHLIFSGKKPRTAKMQIVVDTREQRPLWKGKDCKRMKMDCGDYTTESLFNKFHIERKSLEDLYGTILSGHVRFRKEQLRALSNNVQLSLYIEGTKKDFGAKRFNGGHKRQTAGSTLVKIIDSIESRWPLEVVWCGSRLKAKKMIYERLQKEEKKVNQNV
jgi:hypothetical protein